MANFKGWALTNQGTALLNSLNGLNFTKAMTSISQINLADIPAMAALLNAQQSASKMSKSAVNNQARIAMLFTNENVQTAYSITAVGLYVANQSNVDTLFAVGVLDQPVQMPAIVTQASSFGANLLIGISPDQVTVSVNNVGYALQQDLQSLTDSTANSFLAVNNQLKTMPTIIQMNNGDATTLTIAKKYSDDSIATAIAPLAKQSDMTAGDAATLATAKGYTDQKIGSVDFSNLATKIGPSQTISAQTTFSGGAYVVSNGTSISLATSFLNNNKNLNDSDLIEGHYNCYGYSLVNAPVTGSVYATLDVRADGGDNTIQTFTDIAKSLVYVRTKRANVWGVWQQLATASTKVDNASNADSASKIIPQLVNGADLNSLNQDGVYVYRQFTTPTNAPSGISGWSTVEVISNSQYNGVQKLTDTNSGLQWLRVKNDSKWGAWQQLVMGQVPSQPSITISNTKGDFIITPPASSGTFPVTSYNIRYTLNGSTSTLTTTSLSGSLNLTFDPNNDKTYTINVTAINVIGESMPSSTVTLVIPKIDGNVYTLKYDGSATGGLTRADAAVGLVAGVDGARNDFDNVGPWAKMTKVTDSNGNVFVRIPKTYIRKQVNGNGQNWSVSLVSPVTIPNGQPLNDTSSGWYLPKCFWDFTNNVELPYVDVGAYLATNVNGVLKSQTGVMATVNQNINQFRQQAKAAGNGSQLIDIHITDLLQALFVVEFGVINSQSIMVGATSNSGQVANGLADNIKGSSGTGTSSVMSYRGIENLWGNLWQFLDGVNYGSSTTWVCEDSSKYQSDVLSNPYSNVGYIGTSGWSSKLRYDSAHPYLQSSVQNSGNGSNYYADDTEYPTSQTTIALYGGDWGSGSGAGLFVWSWNGSSSSNAGCGSRLIKKAL